MEHDDRNTPGDGEARRGSAGLVFVTVAALLMAMAVAILPVWFSGRGETFQPDVWQTFYGDLHTLLLPIPIGVFALVLLMEVCGVLSFGKWKPHTAFPLFFGVVSAVAVAIAGNFLNLRMLEEDGSTYHHIWGFTVFVVLAILTFVSKIWAMHSGVKSPIYGIMLVLTVGALCFTGAQGGVLRWKEPFEAPMVLIFGEDEGKTAVAKPVVADGADAPKKPVEIVPAEKPDVVPPKSPQDVTQAKPDPVKPKGPAAPAGKPAPAPKQGTENSGQPIKPAPPAKVPVAAEEKPKPKPNPAGASAQKPVQERLAYADVVVPILRSRCYECHADVDENPLGKKKIKGSLVLTSLEDMKEGGSEGEAVVPGDLKASLMSVRIHLPMDDDEHMPPEDKDQLHEHEIAILDWWIKSGAPVVSLKEAKADASILAAVAKLVSPEVQQQKRAANVAAEAAAKVEAEKQRKVMEVAMVDASREFPNALTFVSRESSDLQFTAVSMRKDFTDEKLGMLKPVGSGLVEVNLGATSVTDAGLGHLADMPNLRKLHLQQTGVTDAGLDAIAKLQNLEWLNLFGTDVTDAGVKKLEALPKLKKLYLWGTKVTPEGAKALEQKRPGCEVNLGAES